LILPASQASIKLDPSKEVGVCMARYKHIDTSPRLLAVDLSRQLLPGTFEYALSYLLDHEMDLSGLDEQFRNDESGAPAYPPAMLLKVILFAYSRGIVSSRGIERACYENVTFMALAGNEVPHFTTLASFIRSLREEIAPLFAQVLYLCDEQGLIGREHFAIDGVKLPSNASKAKSGTRSEFLAHATKLESEVKKMLARHRDNDMQGIEPDQQQKQRQRIDQMKQQAKELRTWLNANPNERKGSKGSICKSNRTDNESAKMATSKGVIQGYTGVAAVDGKHQIIVEAQAHGTGSEQALLMPVVSNLQRLIQSDTLITADAGYHSEANLKALAEQQINALIPDNGMRQRDERFREQAKHKQKADPLWNKASKESKVVLYQPQDFHYDPIHQTCHCPAGKKLYRNGSNCIFNGYAAIKFRGSKMNCVPCLQRAQCLQHPDKTQTRQVAFFQGRAKHLPESYTDQMKRSIDSEAGRRLYGQRIATVEPVFANIRHHKQLNRFTLRGQAKVDTQWKLYCLVHNIEKLAKHGCWQ
jgi:transposase